MSTFDYVILILLGIGVLYGIRTGALKRIFDIAGLVVGIIVGVKYMDTFVPMIGGEKIPFHLAGVLVLLLSVIFFCLVFRLIAKALKVSNPFITVADKICGAFLGGIELAFFLSILLAFFSFFNYPSHETRNRSVLYGPVSSIVPWAYNAAVTLIPRAEVYSEKLKKLTTLDSLKGHFGVKKR